jgi:predicted cupin superfamily sugar epimerase
MSRKLTAQAILKWLEMALPTLAEGGYFVTNYSSDPGFDPADYTIGQRAALIAAYPDEAAQITVLTR